MKKTIIFLCFVLISVLAASLLTGCLFENGSTPDEATTATEAVTVAEAQTTADPSGTTSAEATTQAENKSTEVSGSSGSSGTGSSGTANNTPKPTTPAANTNDNSLAPSSTNCTITTGSKGYTLELGDTFTYVCKLTTPGKIEDIQVTTEYDSSVLELIDVQFPNLGDSVICNTDLKNEIKFNSIRLKGYDFTKEADLVKIEFKVLKNGGTAISSNFEAMTGIDSTDYVKNYVFVDGVKVKEIVNK